MKAGETFFGHKDRDNALRNWKKEDWVYVGAPKKSRYLPKEAREALTRGGKAATSRARVKGTKKGKQFVRQPKRIAKKLLATGND